MTLYRKYRPQQFNELIGQTAVATTLQQALGRGRIAHAYLFSGPRGTGKTSSARVFSRALSCFSPQQTEKDGSFQFEPCNNCAACLAILENRCTDVIEIDAASNRGIEDIRDLREQTLFPPSFLPKKIYIIDEVHMLTGEAFNALLKTLEEPPSHCLFILATTELHKVPLTIRSRCQLLRFERGDVESIEQKLAAIVAKEKLKVEKGVLSLLARHADGGFRDAETLLERLTTQYSPLTVELASQALGVLHEEKITNLLQAVLQQNTEQATRLLQTDFSQLDHAQERILFQLIQALRVIAYSSPAHYPQPLLSYALEQLLEAYILQKSSPLPSLPLEIACLNICSYGQASHSQPNPAPSPTTEATLPEEPKGGPTAAAPVQPGGIEKKKDTPAQSPALALKVQPVMTESVPVVEVELEAAQPPAPEAEKGHTKDIRRAWKEMIDQTCRENLVLGQALKQTVVHTAENGLLTVHVPYKFHADKMNEKKNQARIHSILKNLTGQDWRVEYQVTSAVPKQKFHRELNSGSVTAEAAAVFGAKE